MLQVLEFGLVFLQSVQMLFGDAFACITINGRQSQAFGIYCSIRQGCPLAPSLYVLATEGFRYFLAKAISQGRVHGISLPNSLDHLVNGHFMDDSFLTLIEDENNVANSLQFLDTFFLASGSTIQWHKILCYT